MHYFVCPEMRMCDSHLSCTNMYQHFNYRVERHRTWVIVKELKKNGFGQRRATGKEAFTLKTHLDAFAFVSLIFTRSNGCHIDKPKRRLNWRLSSSLWSWSHVQDFSCLSCWYIWIWYLYSVSPIRARGELCLQPQSASCNPTDDTPLVYIWDTPECSRDHMVFSYQDGILTHNCSGKMVCPRGRLLRFSFYDMIQFFACWLVD